MKAPKPGMPPTGTTHDEPSKLSESLLAQRGRRVYRAAAARVDPATAVRLRAARRNALVQPGRAARGTSRWLVPAGAFAALALAALMMWQPASRSPTLPLPRAAQVSQASTDIDNELPPDADAADPSLYQNMDFYGWLASSQNPESAPTNR